ncbi:IS5 family transposase [Rhodovulum sulfidophilum]|uniref:IS5 family transposase n=1 Tax=Rhodovulum sulfidophilum TaxID=35806 RepID=UPI001EEE2DFE|nr:IS5 family transposase [Rhodovulum sulfidophilum]
MAWHAPHEGRQGRPPVFSDAAIQFCLSIKVLFKLPLRQTAAMVASLLRLAGLGWPVPDVSTPCRRQKPLKVQIPYRRADGPLNLLVDSTGIKFLGDGEWQARKHGVQGRRQWRKVHLAMDIATSDIRAAEFTPQLGRRQSRLAGPVRPDPRGHRHRDRGWCLRHTPLVIARRGTAIIPIRRNARAWKENCQAALAFVLGPMADIGSPRNETLRATRH